MSSRGGPANPSAGLPNDARERITRAVEGLANDPRPPGHRKLRGREGRRIRVGDYRTVYEIDESSRTVAVLQAGHRRDVYRTE